MTVLRCALYTRKSTEEGLDQAFNSLDAQREACAAYVKSQAGVGWKLIGFEDRHVFQPPFGYYDRDYPGFVIDPPSKSK